MSAEPTQDNKPSKLWTALNSNFVLWILSTVVVGAISFLYNQHFKDIEDRRIKAAQDADKVNKEHFDKIERANKYATMITTLLPHLLSKDPKEIQVAMTLSAYLQTNGELPKELDAVVADIGSKQITANTSPEETKIIESAARVIDLKQSNNNSEKDLTTNLPARVYIQIPDESKRQLAKDIQKQIQDKGFVVPGIENISKKNGQGPKITEIRYYKDQEKAEAQQLVNLLKNIKDLQVTDSPIQVKGNTRPRHYEIWINN